MSNPYSFSNSPNVRGGAGKPQNPHTDAPAVALMVVSIFALVMGVIGIVLDAALLLTGTIGRMDQMNGGGGEEYFQVTVRIIWGIGLIFASAFVLYGAIEMKKMKSYRMAQAAAIVAVIPCVGPCCLLGIPFGIWALIVLNQPEVRNTFDY